MKSKVTDENMITEFKKGYNSYFEQRGKEPIYELTVFFEETALLVKQYDDLVDVIKVAASHLANGAGTEIKINCFIPTDHENEAQEELGRVIDAEIVE